MKILFINRYFEPDHSGTSRILTELTADLRAAGISVSVLASDGDSEQAVSRYPHQDRLNGICVYRVPTWRCDRRSIVGWVLNSISFYPMT